MENCPTQPEDPRRGYSSDQILAATTIEDVWFILGGCPIVAGRGKAFWRDGDGWTVAIDPRRNTWYDHRDNIGGGILHLVAHVRKCSLQDALYFVAELVGLCQPAKDSSARDREIYRLTRLHIDDARHWQRAAIGGFEWTLHRLKAGLFDPTEPQPSPGEVAAIEQFLSRLRSLRNSDLVGEYLTYRQDYPDFAKGLVHYSRERDRIDKEALAGFIESMVREEEAN